MDARISELQNKVASFVHERNWEKFHTPKDLALAIAIETAELLELFQWKNKKEIQGLLNDTKYRNRIEEEIADIMIYILVLSNTLDIELSEAVLQKIQTNKDRYPIPKAKGKATKYTEL
jgi:NTP pyrophosphatase (non-canonical NTP hydrolase)